MHEIKSNKAFLTLAIVGLVLAVVSIANSNPVQPAKQDAHDDAVIESLESRAKTVDRGIRYLTRKNPCWGIAANSKARHRMAIEIVKAAGRHEIPPLLLAVTVKRESSFQHDVTGSIGEVGLVQVHGLAASRCNDLDSIPGQLDCGAAWLRKSFEVCGDWRGAVTVYMSGQCSAGKRSALGKAVTSRLNQWRKLEEVTAECETTSSDHWVCGPPERSCRARIRTID